MVKPILVGLLFTVCMLAMAALWYVQRSSLERELIARMSPDIAKNYPGTDVRMDHRDARVFGLSRSRPLSNQMTADIQATLEAADGTSWSNRVHNLLITPEDLAARTRGQNDTNRRIKFIPARTTNITNYEREEIERIATIPGIKDKHLLLVGFPNQMDGKPLGRIRAEYIRDELVAHGLSHARIGAISMPQQAIRHQVSVFVVEDNKEVPPVDIKKFFIAGAPPLLAAGGIFTLLGLLLGAFIWLPKHRRCNRLRSQVRALDSTYQQLLEETGEPSASSSRRRRSSNSSNRSRSSRRRRK